jgi:hypothetical protein
VQRLKTAVAERKQARERREAGKRTGVDVDAVQRKSVIPVRKRNVA